MNVLVFDTSSDTMYVTLGRDSELIDSRRVKTTEHSYNSAFLVSTIGEIVRQNNLAMQDINAVGVNIGPGSFTGLRASATVARVITQQLDIPAVGVPSMQIYSMLNNTENQALCIMDARRGMAFVGIYDKNADSLFEPGIVEYEKALEMAKEQDYFLISDRRMAKKLDNCVIFEDSDVDFGNFLLKLTTKQLETEKPFSWSELKPLYIQSPPITISKRGVR